MTGDLTIASANASFNMLVFTLKGRYRQDPTPDNLEELRHRAYAFCTKFEKILSDELNQLAG